MKKRPVIAVVTGFNKIEVLNRLGFEQLRKLHAAGVIDRILYVTWDSPRLDPLIEPIATVPGLELVRIPEPQIEGVSLQKSITYQIRNLEYALELIDDDDALLLKTRSDLIFANENFIREKIETFDSWSAPSDLPSRLKLHTPPPAFTRKLWIPWASASEPMFFSDVAFIGLKRDIHKLADRRAEPYLEVLKEDNRNDRISHMCRFLAIFDSDYPMLKNFFHNIRYYMSTLDYRDYFAYICGRHPYFWRLALLNAWILETHFHIDGGHNGDIIFCSNRANTYTQFTKLEDLRFEPPMNVIDTWRKNMEVGSLKVCWKYTITVLASDAWQRALFTHRRVDDYLHRDIVNMLADAVRYEPSQIGKMEEAFYAEAEGFYQKYITENPGVLENGTIEHQSRSKKAAQDGMIEYAIAIALKKSDPVMKWR